jgi:hypothetical protein
MLLMLYAMSEEKWSDQDLLMEVPIPSQRIDCPVDGAARELRPD